MTDVNAHGEIKRAIVEQLTELNLDHVRVEIEPTTIGSFDLETARSLGNRYDASLIIWGSDTSVRVEVNFINLKQPYAFASNVAINETVRTQIAAPDDYAQFIVEEVPTQMRFLSLFAIDQSLIAREQYTSAIKVVQSAIESISDPMQLPQELEMAHAHQFLVLQL